MNRREFLGLAIAGGTFDWIPFLRHGHVSLAGARFGILRNGRSRRRYLLIHGDEETARQVVQRQIDRYPGVAFLIEGHTRYVPIDSGRFDPNRIFSHAGAEANLKTLNPGWTPAQLRAALGKIDRDREKLVRALLPPPGGLLVALHNNSNGYSVADEQPISNAASIRERDRLTAFFLCTDPEDYKVLATSPYNVVLQQHVATDDGSLSRLAAARGVRYVNIEVGLGHPARQKEMLAWMEWYLP